MNIEFDFSSVLIKHSKNEFIYSFNNGEVIVTNKDDLIHSFRLTHFNKTKLKKPMRIQSFSMDYNFGKAGTGTCKLTCG